jgi:EAL domain-containing protein (putative c-di-GMP-specific phosphodiesterase class I)
VEGPFLSINLNPDALSHAQTDADSLVELLRTAGRSPQSVVVEVVRPASIAAVSELLTLMQPYRAAGMRIALAGVDEPDEALLVASPEQPDYVKLARPAVAAIGEPSRRAFALRSLSRAALGGPVLIAEGIELPETAQLLLDIGFDLGQGYLLGRPAALDREGRMLPAAGPGAA